MSSFRKHFTVTRKSAGKIVSGSFQEGPTTTLQIWASAQPLKPELVQQYNFGRRQSKYMSLITDTQLFPLRPATSTSPAFNPDLVLINGEQYNVEKEEIWGNGVLPHYKYLVVKVIEV